MDVNFVVVEIVDSVLDRVVFMVDVPFVDPDVIVVVVEGFVVGELVDSVDVDD